MKKYEYMMVRKNRSAFGVGISAFLPTGEEIKYKVDSFSDSDIVFIKIVNELGSKGWEFFDTATDPVNGFLTIFAYLRREINES